MKRTSILFVGLLWGTLSMAQLSIPDAHPRLWWNPTTLENAKSRFESDPFEPRAKGDFDEIENGGWKWNNEVAIQNALYYLFTGDQEAAQTAIGWAKYNLDETLEEEMDEEGISCDRCRWWLQTIILVYDWCYPELSSGDRKYFQTEISRVVERWNSETRWGTPDEPASNYNQGYMRNSFLWGVTSSGEVAQAQSYIDHALEERWANFEHYFNDENQSGIPTEGTSYGHTLLTYLLVMFETSRNLGMDLFSNDFFKKAVLFTIYHTTPGPTGYPSGNHLYATFPFGDASAFWDGRDVIREMAPFMFYVAYYLEDTYLSSLIYDWSTMVGISPEDDLLRYLVSPIEGGGLQEQPLDYYPTEDGIMGQAFARTDHGAQASALHFQLVVPELGGHEHQDGLNFSWWRKGSFLAMEVPGRGFGSGWTIPGYETDEPLDVQATLAHNSLLFGGEGQAAVQTKAAQVLRMQSHDNFFYTAVDATNSYRSANEGDDRYNNEFISQVIREYLFIRPLETLIVFDRMLSNEDAGDLRKTFITHMLGEPVEGESGWVSTYYGQETRLQTLWPENPKREIIYEGIYREEYQDFYRIQVETNASAEEYFLHAIQACDADESPVEIDLLSSSGNSLTLNLSHQTKGFAKLILRKGIDSEGGAFAYSSSALPQELPLLHDTVQLRELTMTYGFRWLNLDGTGGTILSPAEWNKEPLTLWPNPAEKMVYLSGISESEVSIEILDLNGRILLRQKVENSVDVSSLSSGIYLMKITTDRGSQIRKLIRK